jgi:hypothetical protein
MGVEEFRPPPSRLRLASILRFQRYRGLDSVEPPVLEVAQEMVALAERLVEPRVFFTSRAVDRLEATSLSLAGGPTFTGHCFAAHLTGTRDVICWVATLGPALDDRATELADGNALLEAVFLESAGWLAVEDALRDFRADLTSRLRPRRLRPGPRLGPGYLDWSLAEQAVFFSLFAGASMPVSINDACVMIPRKSISGLFGLIPRA